jgi:hypothetical protein
VIGTPLELCATVGALFLDVDDVPGAARAVASHLTEPSSESGAMLERLGVDSGFVRDVRSVLPSEGDLIRASVELGAAWALGRRSVLPVPTWDPVVTSGDLTVDGIDRMTAETLIGLVVGARRTVRLFSAYVDHGGLDVLAVSLAAATCRAVSVAIGYAHAGDKAGAMEPFVKNLRTNGDSSRLRVVRIEADRPFPHLKLLAVDGIRAYLGSANLTWPALTSNVEFGALVSGSHVQTLERCFDDILAPSEE